MPDPLDRALDDISDDWRGTSAQGVIDDLIAEVRRVRAENAEYRQMQREFTAHLRAVEQVALPLAWDDGEGGRWHGGRSALLVLEDAVSEVRRLRGLLARCVDHIDPNDSDAAYRLLVECEEASRG